MLLLLTIIICVIPNKKDFCCVGTLFITVVSPLCLARKKRLTPPPHPPTKPPTFPPVDENYVQ